MRVRTRDHDESVLVRGLTGYASSLAAIAGVSDLDVTMSVSRRRVSEYMDATARDFRELVRTKRSVWFDFASAAGMVGRHRRD